MKPRITCVIPVFNDRDRLPLAVSSALRQMEDVQVVVVDDGSRDGSGEVAEALARADSRVVAIALRNNMGQATARNLGISRAEGSFVAFLDSDDQHADGFYAHAMRVLESSPDLAAVRGHFELFQPDGPKIELARDDPRYAAILNSTVWSLVVERQIAASIGFPTCAPFHLGSEDIVFLHTLVREFRIAQIGSLAARVLVKPGGHTAHFLWGTPITTLPPLDAAMVRSVNEAVAREIEERRRGVQALVRRRDPKG